MTKNKGGRPTVMTEETVRKLEEAFSWGCTDTEACLWANISRAALYDYEKKKPKFIDRKKVLKESLTMHARRNITDAIINKKKTGLSWDYLQKKTKEFTEKQDHNIKGQLSGNVIVRNASPRPKQDNDTD